ncbi:MAG: restriction endonuclease subunit S [Schwartzia sp.]|nr:restriction endonuclease subunit S [Schwartzia sp. (in: firmicutes)]
MLSEIFDMSNTKSIVQNEIIPNTGKTPYVTASSGNNGVMTYISCPKTWLDKGNCIMIGGKSLTFTYQENDFCSNDSHNIALYMKDSIHASKKYYLFMIAALRASLNMRYTWGSSISMKKILTEHFYLPVTEDGNLDFDFMERFIAELEAECIKELEAERIKELEAYLEATGLKDYKLTAKEESALGGDNRAWKTFNLCDLFTKKTMKGYPKNAENLEENPCGYPIYGQNIKWQYPHKVLLDKKYLHEVDHDYPILAYTSSVGEIGMIDESFYRSGDNGAFQGLFPKSRPYSRYELQFILCALKRHFAEFGYATSMADIMNLNFALPVQTDDVDEPIIDDKYTFHSDGYIPDFSFMTTVISAVQKLVIRDVVLYSEKKIAAAKEAVQSL